VVLLIILLKSNIMDIIIPDAWWAHGNPLMLFLPQPLKWFVARYPLRKIIIQHYIGYYSFLP